MTSQEIRRQFIDFFVQKHGHTFVPSSPVVPHDDPTLLFTNAGMNQFKPYFLGTIKPPYPRAANTQKCIRAGGKHNDLDDVGRSRRHHTFFEMLGNWSFGDYFKRGAIEMAWELLTKVWGLDPTRLHVSCYEGDAAHGVPRDDEAAKIWKEVAGLPDDHIHYFGKDNFWEMGETGPCGPCTEIYVDRTTDKTGGPQVNGTDPRVMEIWNLVFIQYNRDAAGKLTTLPSQHVDTGMGLERICQVLQGKDDNYATDLFTPLFDAISQISNLKYTGQFPATNAADPVAEAANPQLRHDIAFRVIADHVRCLTFALTDGAMPSNEGRGYVLRRILRRAVFWGRKHLGIENPFIHTLVPVIVEMMGGMFPELSKDPQHVVNTIKSEEESFGRTLNRGIHEFLSFAGSAYIECFSRQLSYSMIIGGDADKVGTMVPEVDHWVGIDYGDETPVVIWAPADKGQELWRGTIGQLDGGLVARFCSGTPIIAAKDAFKLHDTYGFPIDLTRIMAEERGMKVDVAGYEVLMEKAKDLARSGGKAEASAVFDLPPNVIAELEMMHVHPTDDQNKYEHKQITATVRAIWNGSKLEQSTSASDARPGQQVALILDKTNFYAEMGGQVGDSGEIRTANHAIFIVETTRAVAGYVLHVGHIGHGRVEAGDSVEADVLGGRGRIQQNHTATHLANWALREVLGDHVQQKGSLVDDEKLRFDFIHQKSLADDELGKVETLVCERIERQWPVYTQVAPQEQALKIHGLRAIFGEKYPPMVRVVSIGAKVSDLLADPANPQWRQYSVEFCGGTHLVNTSEAAGFVITAEEAVSKGIRRIVALTGNAAKDAATQSGVIESLLAQAKQTPDENLPGLIAALQKAIAGAGVSLRVKRKTQAAITDLQAKHKQWQKAQGTGVQGSGSNEAAGSDALLAKAQTVNGTALIVASVPDASADALRNTMDWLKKKHPQGNIALLLASAFTDKDKDGNTLPPKVNLLAAVGDPLIGKLKAGDWIKTVAPLVGGTGGGRPQLAMAGGKDVSKIDEALAAAREYAVAKLV